MSIDPERLTSKELTAYCHRLNERLAAVEAWMAERGYHPSGTGRIVPGGSPPTPDHPEMGAGVRRDVLGAPHSEQ